MAGGHGLRHTLRSAISIHRLLRLSLHLLWLTVSIHRLLHARLHTRLHTRLHSVTWHSAWRHSTSWGLASCRWLPTSCCCDQVVLLKVTAKLVVIDALLELDQYVIQLHVEVSALLKQHGKLVLNNDSFVNLLEELALLWIITNLANYCVHTLGISDDLLSDFNLLLFQRVVLPKVFQVLLLKFLKHCSLISLPLVNKHQLLHGVKAIVHRHTILHHFLFL